MDAPVGPPEWRPLLCGVERQQALEAVREVVDALLLLPAESVADPGLISGAAGLAVFFHHLTSLDERCAGRAEEMLERAVALVNEGGAPPGLHSGVAGVAWAVDHCTGGSTDPAEDFGAEVDEALAERIERTPWTEHYELRSGLAGLGVYALDRLPRESAARCLRACVARLKELAEPAPPGLSWRTPPAHILVGPANDFPHGFFDLGTMHGVPALLQVLAGCVAHRVEAVAAGELLDGAHRWLMAQARPRGAPSFGHYVHAGVQTPADRFSACIGDPGVLGALWAAARLARPGWTEQVLALARSAAAYSSQVETVSSNLCCGTAGVGHLFNRLFQESLDPALGAAARLWLTRTVRLRLPGRGVGGYCFEQDPSRSRPDLQFGAAGIALALWAACTAAEPSWDRALLMSAR